MRAVRTHRLLLAACTAAVAGVAVTAVAVAGDNDSGFKTSAPPMVAGVKPGVTVTPIITVGETLPGGYRFESIPDGIALRTRGQGRVDLYVNHETSLVPFPVFPPTTFYDYTNAMVSKLTLNQHSAGVLHGSYAIPSEANYQRFCSNFLDTEEHGFEFPILFTNEEATDFVYRTGTAWPVAPSDATAEQAGVVVAYDVKRDRYKTIYGMGRHNHENSVAIPGYGHPVVLSGDDTFSPPSSQLYLYSAGSAQDVWDDTGTLYAFKSSNPAVNDYGDLPGVPSVSGTFIPVPDAIARGGQSGLESWSNTNGVFQFIRLEDIAYDRNTPNVVYLADTGEPRALPDALTTRLKRGPSGTLGPYPNGRIFRLELDLANPLNVLSLSVLINADTGGYNNVGVIHQPDNVETTAGGLLIQEDPGSHNQGATTARIWRYDLWGGTLEVVAKVDQSSDTAVPPAKLGAWESSGIIDASAAFGPGAFLVTVQAGSLSLDRQVGPDANSDGKPDWVLEREGGQLLLVRIPGA